MTLRSLDLRCQRKLSLGLCPGIYCEDTDQDEHHFSRIHLQARREFEKDKLQKLGDIGSEFCGQIRRNRAVFFSTKILPIFRENKESTIMQTTLSLQWNLVGVYNALGVLQRRNAGNRNLVRVEGITKKSSVKKN